MNKWHKQETKEHICIWSDEWIENAIKSQPDRLNPEASKIITHPIPDFVKQMFGRCDSQIPENK